MKTGSNKLDVSSILLVDVSSNPKSIKEAFYITPKAKQILLRYYDASGNLDLVQ